MTQIVVFDFFCLSTLTVVIRCFHLTAGVVRLQQRRWLQLARCGGWHRRCYGDGCRIQRTGGEQLLCANLRTSNNFVDFLKPTFVARTTNQQYDIGLLQLTNILTVNGKQK